MTRIAGIDGCKAGWLVALASEAGDDPPCLLVVGRLADLFARPDRPDFVAIDMPIGLPERIEGAGRGPERLVRAEIGKRRSSVFSIPSRAALQAQDHGEACRLARLTSSPPSGVSIQGFGLFPKIRELDALLRTQREWQERVFETHPELVFRTLKGEPLLHAKKTPAGIAERQALLVLAGLAEALVQARPPKGAAVDDALDALAALVVAREIAAGRGRPLPDQPGRDGHGLPIAIWTFEPAAIPG